MRHVFVVGAASFLFSLSACGDSYASAPAPSAQTAANFSGQLSGTTNGEISGPGKLQFLSTAGYENKGYFFLTDNMGIRDYGITFTLPKDVKVGRLTVATASPLDVGTITSVRVEKELGNKTHMFEKDASGYLEITSFPAQNGTGIVSGSYNVKANDLDGKPVEAVGDFRFDVSDIEMPN